MLVSQQAQYQSEPRQGRRESSLAELRRQLTDPSGLKDGHRQRLLELSGRLARVQALGDEYARIGLSEFVTAATDRCEASA